MIYTCIEMKVTGYTSVVDIRCEGIGHDWNENFLWNDNFLKCFTCVFWII